MRLRLENILGPCFLFGFVAIGLERCSASIDPASETRAVESGSLIAVAVIRNVFPTTSKDLLWFATPVTHPQVSYCLLRNTSDCNLPESRTAFMGAQAMEKKADRLLNVAANLSLGPTLKLVILAEGAAGQNIPPLLRRIAIVSAGSSLPPGAPAKSLLFAYGTLQPATDGDAQNRGWTKDAVRGNLFDLGSYPGLILSENSNTPWVDGYFLPVSENALKTKVDLYENVDKGLYHRQQVVTRGGALVWVYAYNSAIPAGARGPLLRWDGNRGVRLVD